MTRPEGERVGFKEFTIDTTLRRSVAVLRAKELEADFSGLKIELNFKPELPADTRTVHKTDSEGRIISSEENPCPVEVKITRPGLGEGGVERILKYLRTGVK